MWCCWLGEDNLYAPAVVSRWTCISNLVGYFTWSSPRPSICFQIGCELLFIFIFDLVCICIASIIYFSSTQNVDPCLCVCSWFNEEETCTPKAYFYDCSLIWYCYVVDIFNLLIATLLLLCRNLDLTISEIIFLVTEGNLSWDGTFACIIDFRLSCFPFFNYFLCLWSFPPFIDYKQTRILKQAKAIQFCNCWWSWFSPYWRGKKSIVDKWWGNNICLLPHLRALSTKAMY